MPTQRPDSRSGNLVDQEGVSMSPPALPAFRSPHAPAWLNPVMMVVLLTAGVLAFDALLPGLPGAQHGLIGRLSALMSGICPQRPSHSYTLGGIQLPLEARMMGMFGGFTDGALVLGTISRKRMHHWPRLPVALVVVGGVGLMAFDGLNAFFFDLHWPHAYIPDLRLRLLTGLLTGMAMAFFLVPVLAEVGMPAAEDSAAPGWRDLGWVAAGSAFFGLLVASGWQALLAPVALIGVSGVVMALFAVNRMVLWGLTGAQPASSVRQVVYWGLNVLASGLVVGELILLALLFTHLREALLLR